MKSAIDLNSDLGEGAGSDDELLSLVSSANIACGFHAGNADTMRSAIAAAQSRGVAVGVHPSLFDRENFGRKELPITCEQLYDIVSFQLGIFQAVAETAGARVSHVKPHGALYNMAARDLRIAESIIRAIHDVDPILLVFTPGSSALATAAQARGLTVVPEVFADRGYMKDGSLVPRERPGALLKDPEAAATRVVRMLHEAKVRSIDGYDVAITAETVCVHGDTPDAVAFARALRQKLEEQDVEIRAPGAATG
jgi:UPF0271 protein